MSTYDTNVIQLVNTNNKMATTCPSFSFQLPLTVSGLVFLCICLCISLCTFRISSCLQGRLTLLPINPCATFRSRCLDLVCHRQLNLRDIPLDMLLCATNNILFFLFSLISLDRPSNVTHFFVEKSTNYTQAHIMKNWTHFQTTGSGTSC